MGHLRGSSNEAHPSHMNYSRILVIPKDPVQASPLKGWNNAYHGTIKYGVIYPVDAHVTEEGV